jgi:hypothetical protein
MGRSEEMKDNGFGGLKDGGWVKDHVSSSVRAWW